MPPDNGSVQPPPTDSRTIVALAERLTRVETKQEAMAEGINVIRATNHDIRNEMQRFVAAEQQCASHLEQIAHQTRDLPTMAAATAAFSAIHEDLRRVINDQKERHGIAEFIKRLAMIAGAAAALLGVLGAIAGFLVWMIQHVKT